ncbi:MAG: glycogen debranching enzyme family protein [Planctomycetes bacterium]|nr:glycogen debranching enzyme family protein [Planctomycetota bacterium]
MNRTLLTIDREELLQLDRSMTREWLETDGMGGYASSTVLMCPTRRYHGLLVAPIKGSVKRYVLLSRFEEALEGGGKSVPLSMARYRGLWSPLGHQCIEKFELGPYPSSLYLFGNARIQRDVMMVRGQHTVLVRWRVSGQRNAVTLSVKPLVPFREADALTVENDALDTRIERIAGGIKVRPYAELPGIALTVSGDATFEADGVWYRGLEYSADIARGYDGHEDQFSPGEFKIKLEDGVDVVVATTLGEPIADPRALWERESKRRSAQSEARPAGVRGTVAIGADAFLYRAHDRRLGVIAGYPWFLEWGRDTFLSLPGLLLARGRIDECGEALAGALTYLQRGLLPNVFGLDPASSAYNSVDASLWFARCVRLYEQAGAKTTEIVERFLPALREIARAYRDGTDLGVRCDAGGLIVAGGPHLNATWMDARLPSGPVTPRDGCAVEIQALWYALLAHLEHLETAAGNLDAARKWGEFKKRTGATFVERFWLRKEARLADVWIDGKSDRSLRPNMVIAAALEWSPLTKEQRADIVVCARAELVTPRGLRTLGPRERAYQGRYSGNTEQRDNAYHQGTVWPWLIGFYVEAALRSEAVRPQVLRELLDGFAEHLSEAGIAHLSEVFDGDPPHASGGTIAQAWSEAEWLRADALLRMSAS